MPQRESDYRGRHSRLAIATDNTVREMTRAMINIGVAHQSNARIPRIAAVGICPAQSLAEAFQAVRDCHVVDVFDALVAQLPRDAQPERTAEGHRQIAI